MGASELGVRLVASIALLALAYGAVTVVRSTPVDTPVLFDGTVLFSGLVFAVIGTIGLIRIALS